MFDPLFLGTSSKINNVNLSTSTSTTSSALLSSVRAERQAREAKRTQELAALKIQKVWRGRKVARSLERELMGRIEKILAQSGLNVEKVGRELVIILRGPTRYGDSLKRKQRIAARWCEAGLSSQDGRYAIITPLEKDPEWGMILALLSVRCVRLAELDPCTPDVAIILNTLEIISNSDSYGGLPLELLYTARESWLQVVQRNYWTENLVSILSQLVAATPVKLKNPILLPLTKLLSAPLSVGLPAQLALTLTPLVNELLAFPNLPSVLPLQALTYLSVNLHIFDFLLPYASHNLNILVQGKLSTEMGKTNFLANLATFGISGGLLARNGVNGISCWMSVVGNVLGQMQEGWGKWVEGIIEDDDVYMETDDDDSEGEVTGEETTASIRKLSRPRRPSLDRKIRSKLVLLSSTSHTSILSHHILSPSQLALDTLLGNFSSFFLSLLNTLRGSPRWETVLDSLLDGRNGVALMKTMWRDGVRGKWEESENPSVWQQFTENPYAPCLLLLTHMYCHYLLLTPDDEFFSPSRNPFNMDEILQLTALWRNLAYWGYMSGTSTLSVTIDNDRPGYKSTEEVRRLFTKGVVRVSERNARKQFADPDFWVMKTPMDMQGFVEAAVYEDAELSGLTEQEEERTDSLPRWARVRQKYSKRQMAYISPRLGLLNNLPMAVPFQTRLMVFRMFIEADRKKIGINYHDRRYTNEAKIRRDHISQDGFDELSGLESALKGRVDITFIDKHGIAEAGIDGGGLYKEFLTMLSKEIFDTNRGLWLVTNQNELYPNPHSYASESHNLSWYRFIGQVLGKAIYDGILVDVTFAGFFLAKWLGRQSYLDDLASLDKDLYKGLIILKNDPKPEDMALTFSITDEEFGVQRQIDLLPGGSEISVTAENRHEYIQLVCKYRLDRQISAQSRAFFVGLSDLIDAKWLRMFDQQELQQLIGGEEAPVDIKDLKAHCNFDGFPSDVTPRLFWKVVAEFDEEQKRALLRFVTSCSRPPLLGFSQLNPQFAVKFNGSDMNRLPTASACFNLLKLPGYTSEHMLRTKLLQAITSGAGFHMS
ncbi:hypothetical protein L204_104307 [Cryptococcus depauperatus]